MLTKLRFKELFEDNGIVKDREIRMLIENIEIALESNDNKNWLLDRKDWLIDLSQCLHHYVNDVERDISKRKEDKSAYGLSDRNEWLSWVEAASNFKNKLNDLRLHTEEIKVLVISKLKQINKAIQSEAYLSREANKNIPRRFAIQVTLNKGNYYENIIIYSDITKISDIDIALKYIDLYQTKSEGVKSVVNYRVFVTSKDFHLENSKMIEASSLL